MALFSEVDWLVIGGVAAFLFFGPQGQQFVRQLGRWYGRLLQLKAEILSEVTASAGLPPASGAPVGSIRSTLLGLSAPATGPVVPSTDAVGPGIITRVQPAGMWSVETQLLGAGMGPGTWWVTTTSAPGEVVRLR
ncbi:MAG TPA: hypothetical protein VEH57_08585 [Thermoplasmata archaeon]|nr:hypothetical protein [Thermoplasmata archaeon]